MAVNEQIVLSARNEASKAFQQMENDARKSMKTISSEAQGAAKGLGAIDKALLRLVTGGALMMVGRKMVDFGKQSVAAAEEAAQAQAQLEAVIRSTGGAAGMSAQEVNTLSSELSKLTGIDDDLITRNQALMLTFKEVSREVFPEAMAATLDMSAAMRQDLQSSIIMVGKALNDPKEGLTALRRVGIQFTDTQEDMIKSLVEEGKVLDAQNIILTELRSQFGGAAQAMHEAGSGADSLGVSYGNLQEQIGRRLLPRQRELNQELTRFLDAATRNMLAQNDLYDAREQGLITDKEYRRWLVEMRKSTFDAAEAEEFLAEKTEELNRVEDDAIDHMRTRVIVTKDVADATAILAAQMERERLIVGALAAGLKGVLLSALTEYDTKLDELRVSEEETILALIDAKRQYGANSTKVKDLTAALEENRVKQGELREELRLTTAEMLYQQIAQNLSGTAALDLARGLGLLSEADYAVAASAQLALEWWDKNKSGMIDAGAEAAGFNTTMLLLNQAIQSLIDKGLPLTVQNIAEEYVNLKGVVDEVPPAIAEIGTSSTTMSSTAVTKVGAAGKEFGELRWEADQARGAIDRAKAALDRLKSKTITITTVYKTKGGYIPEQHGGPVRKGGAYWVGEAGPEPFIAPSNGYILSHSEARGILAGAGAAPAMLPMPGMAAQIAGGATSIDNSHTFIIESINFIQRPGQSGASAARELIARIEASRYAGRAGAGYSG